ncbi:MAG TPA: nitroreductase/quinone reductase family protein [Candidatus Limnocylindrales bacterium]|nr:nitroreductase/quinone reductase family protein [Candidatus Limnocylindrales bacterium]
MDQLRLRTIGRRTGETREASLFFVPDGPNLALAASNEGADEPPAWYANLHAQPVAEIEHDGVVRAVRARDATPAERARIYPQFIAGKAAYAEYERMTSRPIAVVIIEPIEGSDGGT